MVPGVARGLTYQEFSEAVGLLALVWSRSGQMPACCPKDRRILPSAMK